MSEHADVASALLADLDVLVLAGGRGSRLGGADKSALVFRSEPIRRHVLTAVRAARRVVWVGESTRALLEDAWQGLVVTRERPAFAGPSAAIAAGLAAIGPDAARFTLVLAADLPRAADAVPELLRRFAMADGGVIAVDGTGRRQFLLGVYPSAALRREVAQYAAADGLDGVPLRRLIDAIELTEVQLDGDLCADIDTPADAARHGIRLPVLTGSDIS